MQFDRLDHSLQVSWAGRIEEAIGVAQRKSVPMQEKASTRRVQPVWGSTINLPLLQGKGEAGSGWSVSSYSDVSSEKMAEKHLVVQKLMHVVKFLEDREIFLAVRQLAQSDEELKELLRPRRPSTVWRHARMFCRFIQFVESHPEYCYKESLVIDDTIVADWIKDLIDHKVGRYTPVAAMACLEYMAELLEFDYPGEKKVLRNEVNEYVELHQAVVKRAAPYSINFLHWLESMVLNEEFADTDRLVCGRWRIMVQASIRFDDMKRTPVGQCLWVVDKDGNKRALWARATQTKTSPRKWICSVGAVAECNVGWLEATVKLLRQAHGKSFKVDDHFGKRALPDRSDWDEAPPDGQSDTCHIRYLMLATNRMFDPSGELPDKFFAEKLIAETRHQSAKPTFTSCAQYLQHKGSADVNSAAVRNQGGWKVQGEDAMPDKYLRSKQTLALELQEKCLEYIGANGALEYDSMLQAVECDEEEADYEGEESSEESLPIEPSTFLPEEGQDENTEPGKAHVASPVPPMEGDEEAVASSDSVSDISRSVECSELLYVPEPEVDRVQCFLCHVTTFTYHRQSEIDPVQAACNRVRENLIAKDAGVFEQWRESRTSRACGVCFPVDARTSEEPCKHVCGRIEPDGCCALRCTEIHNSYLVSHDCRSHTFPSVKEAKRAKLSAEIKSLNVLVAESQSAMD